MEKEELEAGKFYWVEWIDGELDVGEYVAFGKFMVTGMIDPVEMGQLRLKRVICECVKPEDK